MKYITYNTFITLIDKYRFKTINKLLTYRRAADFMSINISGTIIILQTNQFHLRSPYRSVTSHLT